MIGWADLIFWGIGAFAIGMVVGHRFLPRRRPTRELALEAFARGTVEFIAIAQATHGLPQDVAEMVKAAAKKALKGEPL